MGFHFSAPSNGGGGMNGNSHHSSLHPASSNVSNSLIVPSQLSGNDQFGSPTQRHRP